MQARKMLKRYLGIAMAIFVLLSFMLFAVACDGDEKQPESDSVSESENNTNNGEDNTEITTEGESGGGEVDTSTTENKLAEYKITVVDKDGNPISGVQICVCSDSGCSSLNETNAEGKVTIKYYKGGNPYAHVLSSPEEYPANKDDKYYFEGDSVEVTIVLEKVCLHKYVTIPAKSPTCTEDGYTESEICEICGDVKVASKVQKATGHKPSAPTATCTKDQTCLVCKEVLAEKTGHVEEVVKGYAATHTENGLTDGIICSICKTVIKEQEVIVAKGEHTPQNGYPCKVDIYCTVCRELISKKEDVPHTPGAEATCTTAQKCTVCKNTLVKALGHLYEGIYDTNPCQRCEKAETAREMPEMVGFKFQTFGVGTVEKNFISESVGEFRSATVAAIDTVSGGVNFSSLYQSVSLLAKGYAGFSYKSTNKNVSAKNFGYYFDDNTEGLVTIKATTASKIDKEDKNEAEPSDVAGNKVKGFDIEIDTTGLSNGQHTVVFVAQIDNGICVKFAEWTINVTSKITTSDKPAANVIIISGQSNAYGASRWNGGIPSQLIDKTYNNVYIKANNINVDASGLWKSHFSTNGFESYKIGVGAEEYNGPNGARTSIGPEYGIVEYLTANGYADETPLYIIKFTAAGTFLNGQWFEGLYDTYDLVDDMGDYLYNQMVKYIDESIEYLSDDYNVQIQSFFWIQGESDSAQKNSADQYEAYEQMLVRAVRADFAMYASNDGISFINYAIQDTQEGSIKWTYSDVVNEAKRNNCGMMYNYDEKEYSENSNCNIKNSYLVYADTLTSKGTEGLEGDYAHLYGDSMIILGQLMGEGMLRLKGLINN